MFVAIDIFVILGFLCFLCSEKRGERQLIQFFKKYQLTLKDFSLKVSGFSSKNFDAQFHDFVDSISSE